MSTPAKLAVPLAISERTRTGCTHVQMIDFNDLTDTAGTTKTFSIFTGAAKQGLGRIFHVIDTNFDGGSTTDMTITGTLNYASTTDKTVIAATSVHEDGTEILSGPAGIAVVDDSSIDATWGATELTWGNAVTAALNKLLNRGPIMANEAWTLDILFTASGANLSTLTTGKVLIFFEVIDLVGFTQVA